MAIKNYTSGVDIYTSLGEIQGALARAGATKIMVDYESGKPTAVTFAIETVAGTRGFGSLRPWMGHCECSRRRRSKLTAHRLKGQHGGISATGCWRSLPLWNPVM